MNIYSKYIEQLKHFLYRDYASLFAEEICYIYLYYDRVYDFINNHYSKHVIKYVCNDVCFCSRITVFIQISIGVQMFEEKFQLTTNEYFEYISKKNTGIRYNTANLLTEYILANKVLFYNVIILDNAKFRHMKTVSYVSELVNRYKIRYIVLGCFVLVTVKKHDVKLKVLPIGDGSPMVKFLAIKHSNRTVLQIKYYNKHGLCTITKTTYFDL